MISQSEITYDVFISDPISQAVATLLPNGDHPMWSPMSGTLIYGPTEAVLIDPPLTIKQAEALADWVERFGKKLSSIYITHGHGDHWLGTRPLTERFPGVSVYATEGTLEVMRQNALVGCLSSSGQRGSLTRFPTRQSWLRRCPQTASPSTVPRW